MKGYWVLAAFVAAWLVAQICKMILLIRQDRKQGKKLDFEALMGHFTRSGGMPSGHTASLTAACVCLGCGVGFDSVSFALALCVLIIVIYDAVNVRYAVGEQGVALNRLLKHVNEKELPIVAGHTVPQVVVGAIIGVVVGLGIFWLTMVI